jgi:serine/threonine protein kinase
MAIDDDIAIPPLSPGDRLVDQHGHTTVIRRSIGRGGAGCVYLGDHPVHGPVAVKIAKHLSGVGDLIEEMRWVGYDQIDEHVASIVDVGVHQGRSGAPDSPFVLLRYFRKGSWAYLGHYVVTQHHDTIGLPLAAQWIADCALALHQMQVIHRDIKPENVLIDDAFHAAMADFGLAVPSQEADRVKAQVMIPPRPCGTPAYMSPEQFYGAQNIDPRSDVFSFGLLLYESATGKDARPDECRDIDELRERFSKEGWRPDPAGLSQHPAVRPIFERATQLRRADRYQSLADFATALKPLTLNAPAEIDRLRALLKTKPPAK